MLARSAQGLYWMSRYLERSEYLCRMLELQVRSWWTGPWAKSTSAGGGSTEASTAGLREATSTPTTATTTHWPIPMPLPAISPSSPPTPDSLKSCFSAGRENARQMRHCISREAWTSLNLTWLDFRDLDIMDIWVPSPETFYADTARAIRAFEGIASATMYRDEGWQFLRLGRFIERAQLVAALLATHCRIAGTSGESEWTSLLRACRALDAYESVHGFDRRPERILDLLVADPLLPGSLSNSLEAVASCLAAVGAGAGTPDAAAQASRLASRLSAGVKRDRDPLDGVVRDTRELHDLVTRAWFEYAIGQAPSGR